VSGLDFISNELERLWALSVEAWDAVTAIWSRASSNPLLIAEVLLVAAAALLLLQHARRRFSQTADNGDDIESAVGGRDDQEPRDRVWRHMLAGCAVVFALIFGLGGWASLAEVAGAVIAQGTVVVDSNVKKVQHPSGGVVGDIRVREGDSVKAGDIVIKLDETQTRANHQIFTKLLAAMAVRQLRLMAERDGWSDARLSQSLNDKVLASTKIDDPDAAREMANGELLLFTSRAKARAGQASQLSERISQLHEEISGLTSQRYAKSREIDLIKNELQNVETLEAKQLVTINRITSLRREEARIEGEYGLLQASIAQARGRIAEMELQILQIENELRSEVTKELREIQNREAELNERRIAAEDQLSRIEIRAPQAGIVHQLAVHTVGGVVNGGDTLMLIVPAGDRLVIDARLAPQDIDQVRSSQVAVIRFPAFNQRTTPEIQAHIERLSADLSRDQQTNSTYFVARLAVHADQLARLGSLQLVPGMPAEVHIKTGERTALSYFVKPLQDQFSRTFRER
jgi:HlyD family secretion protein